ncbi:unnamed protein product [Acanthoscelides obtectus]|uniref:Uncharacterized protein n=1 Tax=Acanthoscelides obtectus TaxID=200917 RepID=A0A9P0LFV9_ACAOB|nr:unnamed protein product [Acanthoscelides obtectus]CAH1997538.1 unnamed protein product [Acanthoscelides obtectus]CAH2015632.1 unnamed protein product [Acanthoscelides obtectus]CAK1625767.1 hypothetical protein AOBTE_LOCUS3388 [Acanthoscelides obtectus]CAK1632038.1 hypothetical protein AOBTE_LOCUS7318 [Acanthoscelides obtectus]
MEWQSQQTTRNCSRCQHAIHPTFRKKEPDNYVTSPDRPHTSDSQAHLRRNRCPSLFNVQPAAHGGSHPDGVPYLSKCQKSQPPF